MSTQSESSFQWPSHHCPCFTLLGRQAACDLTSEVGSNQQQYSKMHKHASLSLDQRKLADSPENSFPILPCSCLAGHQVHKPRMKHWILHHEKESTTRILREVTRTLRSTECLETSMIPGWSRITRNNFAQQVRSNITRLISSSLTTSIGSRCLGLISGNVSYR